MMGSRYIYFQYLAAFLIKKNIPFRFEETYLTASRMSIDLSLDATDRKKVWIERSGQWVSFTDIDTFKKFLKTL